MIDIKTFAKSKDTGGGKVGTSTATTYITGIATEAEHANRADRAKRADSADQAAYANQSGTALTANYAATAGEVKEDAETLQNFLRKDESDDTEAVHRKVDFKKDVNFGGKINAEKEAVFKGNATFYEALFDLLHSVNFNSATQAGFGFTKNALGRYGLSITNLEVWGKAVYNELQIRKLSSIGGNVWLSAASSKIVHVDAVADSAGKTTGYRCYFLAEEGDVVGDNPWREGDLARCETYEDSGGRRMYWMEVSEASASTGYVYDPKDATVKLLGARKCHHVVLSAASVSASGNATPQAGDTIVLDGHRPGTGDTDTDRTNLICIESTGTGTPRIVGLAGITDFTHEGKDVFTISPTGVQFRSEYLKFISAAGKEISALSLWYEVTFDNEKVVYDPNTKAFTPADFGAFHVVRHEGDTQTQLAYEDIEGYCVLYIYGDTKGYSAAEGTDSVSTAISANYFGDAAGLKTVKACYYNCDFSENWSDTVLDELLENGGVPTDDMVSKYGLQLLASNSMAFLQGGENGVDGKGALEISVSPDTIVLDANSNGLVTSLTGKTARISCYRDGTNVTSKCTFSIPSDKVINCTAAVSSSGLVAIRSVSRQTLSDSSTVSMTSGSVMVEISDTTTSKTYYAQVKFAVNVAAYTGTWMATSKSLSSKYTELSTKVTSMGNDVDGLSHDLSEVSSSIEQTARKISLSVTEKAAGRRNLLPGSAFLRQDDGPILNFYAPYGDQGIYIGEGVGGTNCVKCKSYYDGTNNQYSGVYWRALGATRNVKIERGKKYVMSCWVKCDTTAANRIYFENHYKENATSVDRLGSYPMSPTNTFAVREAGVWELFSCAIDATSAKYDYLEVIFLVVARTKGETVNAWFCRPMLEEGEEYNGWTLSEQDYDYVGGNLLDNARSLTLGDNLGTVQGSIVSGGYEAGVSVIYAQASTSYIDILRWGTPDGETYAANTDYIFSFMARGSGGITAYFFRGDNNAALLTETCDGTVTDGDTGQDGNAYLALDGGWRRYWVHWRTKGSNMPQMVLLRVSAGSTAYVTQPKLEVGATMTPWTEKRSDMVERQALLATGIDIANKKVTVTSDNFTVRNNSGDTTLLVDQAGRLNSEIIEAKTVKTYNENGAHIEIGNGLMQVFGTKGIANFRFGVTDDGEAILSYYDNNGEWKYDLGPNQFDAKYTVASSLTAVEVVRARDSSVLGVAAFYNMKTFSNGSKSYNLCVVASETLQSKVFGPRGYASDSDEIKKNPHSGYQPFAKKSATVLYRYTAARVSGKVQPDKSLGLTTQALATQADGKYFTSNSVLGDGTSLKNLASDVYFEKGATVSMAPYPMMEAGSSLDWPAYTIGFIEILQGVCSQKSLYSIIKQTISGSQYAS